MQNLNTGNFKIAAIISFIIALMLFIASTTVGRNDLFYYLITTPVHSPTLFAAITWAGDGTVFIPALLIIFLH